MSEATKLTPPQRRTLEALSKCDRPIPSQALARLLWPDSPAWNRGTGRHDGKAGGKGATMPMKAATMGYRLSRMGLVDYERPASTVHPLWSINSAGRRALVS